MAVKRVTKYQLLKDAKHLKILFLTIFLLAFMGCKKEVVEVSVDAFAQLNTEVTQTQNTYNIQFTLQEYAYKEVGVRLGTSKDMLHKNLNLTLQIANLIGSNKYGAFFNSLKVNEVYYYQIYVKDSASAKEVYSDVFSFTTNP